MRTHRTSAVLIATATREIGRKRDLLTVGHSWRRVISGSRDWAAGFRRRDPRIDL